MKLFGWNGNGSNKYKPKPGTIPGSVLKLRGVEVVITPLCLDDFVALEPEFAGFSSQALGKQMAITVKAAHRSMLANHPDITVADVRQLIDTKNMFEVMAAMVSANELSVTKPGESRPAAP